MSRKAFILSMYAVALYIVLSRWYKAGNSGMPDPSVVTGPSYLYGVLALTSDFLEGLPVVLAAGLTAGLYWRASEQAKVPTKKTPQKKPPIRTKVATTPKPKVG